MDLNIGQTCRGCLSEGGEVQLSFTWPGVRDLYVNCTKLQIPIIDVLPQQICFQCYKKCQEWNMFQLMCKESDASLVSMLTVEQDLEGKPDLDNQPDLEYVFPTYIEVLPCQVKIEPLELSDESLIVNVLKGELTNQKAVSLESPEPNSKPQPVPVVEKRKRGRPRKRPPTPEHEQGTKTNQGPRNNSRPVKNSAEIPIPDHPTKVRAANKISKRCCCRDCRLGFTKAPSLNDDPKKPSNINQHTVSTEENQTESVDKGSVGEREERPSKANSLAEFIEAWNEWDDEDEVQEIDH